MLGWEGRALAQKSQEQCGVGRLPGGSGRRFINAEVLHATPCQQGAFSTHSMAGALLLEVMWAHAGRAPYCGCAQDVLHRTAAVPMMYSSSRLETAIQAGSSPNVSMMYVNPAPATGYSMENCVGRNKRGRISC